MSMSELMSDISSIGGDAGETTDPMLGVLIDALSGKGQIDPLVLLRTQLDVQARDNPKAAQILQLLEQRRQQQNSEPQEEDVILPSEEDAYLDQGTMAEAAQEESARHTQELEDTVNRVYAELEALRVRNDALAAALGACYLCFGDDVLCKECGGRGVPDLWHLSQQHSGSTSFRRFAVPRPLKPSGTDLLCCVNEDLSGAANLRRGHAERLRHPINLTTHKRGEYHERIRHKRK